MGEKTIPKPAAKPLSVDDLIDEVELTTYKSSGPGGQHKNKTESAVRLKHLPTGITVIAREHRSQIKNRELAWQRLIEKLEKRRQKKKPRLPTSVPRSVQEKRLEEKRLRARKKELRSKVKLAPSTPTDSVRKT